MNGHLIHHSPQGTLYDLDAMCALHLPDHPTLWGLPDAQLALVLLAAWALLATLVALFFWTRSPS